MYSPEFKGQVCKRINEGGEKVSQISLELDLHENTIYNWLNSYRTRNGMAFVDSGNIKPEEAEMKRLQRENKELREEVEILKKAAAYFGLRRKSESGYGRVYLSYKDIEFNGNADFFLECSNGEAK